jgi:adenine-specific DNA-methyltransferase
MTRLANAGRIESRAASLSYRRHFSDFPAFQITSNWADTGIAGRPGEKVYVVQTSTKVIERCMLMTTDSGDLVLDPTCGSGTTAYVAEQWGRRWITIDTSRVAIALARQRLLTAKYNYYKLRPVTPKEQTEDPNNIWLTDPEGSIKGPCTFNCKTVPHVTLKSIAQNQNLDPIFAKHKPILEANLAVCNAALKKVPKDVHDKLLEKLILKERHEGKRAVTDAGRRRWVLPPENRGSKAERDKKRKDYTVDLEFPGWYEWEVPFDTDADWPDTLKTAVIEYRAAWRDKMDEVNACIAANAEQEELVDKPDPGRGITRVSGPFTVEAVQPPEISVGDVVGEFDGAPVGLEGTFAVRPVEPRNEFEVKNVLAYLDKMTKLLKLDGVRFPNNKEMVSSRLERIGDATGIHAEGRWVPKGDSDSDTEGPATVGVVFGPQYGPVTVKMLEELIKPAGRRYDDLVVAAFNFTGEVFDLAANPEHPKLRIHPAHIRPDVNPGMAGLLKEQPGSQLFTVFGQPRVAVNGPDKRGEYVVVMEGVDVYNPVDNSIRSTGADKVAAWFLDGDYDGRTFCITQAFFPDKSAWEKLAKALNGKDGVINADRFEALSGTESLPFPVGKHRCVAVKVIDPRGNEVMQVLKIK